MDKKYSKVNVVIGKKQELTEEQQNCDVLCVTMFKDEKDKKIVDLEAKLAESEKDLEIKELQVKNLTESCSYAMFCSIVKQKIELEEQLNQLKQQLAEERKKVVQEIREEFEPKNATELDEDKISTEAHLVNFGWDRCKEKLLKKLDQIERGEWWIEINTMKYAKNMALD